MKVTDDAKFESNIIKIFIVFLFSASGQVKKSHTRKWFSADAFVGVCIVFPIIPFLCLRNKNKTHFYYNIYQQIKHGLLFSQESCVFSQVETS
mmetsp:Transcript_49919/g.85806  ORF Transcript_49919/g.85806 Transcript_49919/m.85806 type:complete len:93 (-) Transcript_49919:270-548(-)